MTKWHHHALWLDFKASGLDCSGLDKQLNQLQTGSIVPRTVLPTDAAAIPYKRDTAGVFAIPEHPHISKQSLSRQFPGSAVASDLMTTALRTPPAQHARPQSPESPAKPVAHPSRRAVLKSGLFAYNASGGAGIAEAQDLGDGRMHVTFDAQSLYIPDVYSKTAKFLGAPLVPPFRIRIEPVKLEAPPLYVVTNLTTEGVQGSRRSGQGKRMDPNGFTKLVGVATVPKTHSWPIDKFLMLPDETFAVMVTQFVFPTA
ncbi:TPA: hypothetical protein ACH3X2_006794 [Trebouxia sp. C0005]